MRVLSTELESVTPGQKPVHFNYPAVVGALVLREYYVRCSDHAVLMSTTGGGSVGEICVCGSHELFDVYKSGLDALQRSCSCEDDSGVAAIKLRLKLSTIAFFPNLLMW